MNLTPRQGIVVGPDQKSVEGAYVTVEWGTAPTPEITQITDKKGRFHLLLPNGKFRITAKTPDGLSGATETRGEANKEAIRIELRKEGE